MGSRAEKPAPCDTDLEAVARGFGLSGRVGVLRTFLTSCSNWPGTYGAYVLSRVSPERGWSEGAEGLLRREFPTEWEDGREYGPGLVADTLRECEACLYYERISNMLSVVGHGSTYLR
jgi:hypothetical protein